MEKLELTPENLRPLLGYVKEVEKRCGECLKELERELNRGDGADGKVKEGTEGKGGRKKEIDATM
jgi:hypothetical protein